MGTYIRNIQKRLHFGERNDTSVLYMDWKGTKEGEFGRTCLR